jgi:GGDEF domain-containing protein
LGDAAFARGPNEIKVTVSAGLALADREPCTAEEFVRRADEALREAKDQGKNRMEFWQTQRGTDS